MALNPFMFQVDVIEVPSKMDTSKTVTNLQINGLKLAGKPMQVPASSIGAVIRTLGRMGLTWELITSPEMTFSVHLENLINNALDDAGKKAGASKNTSLSTFLNGRGEKALSGTDTGEFGDENPDQSNLPDMSEWAYTNHKGSIAFFLSLASEVRELTGASEADPKKAMLAAVAKLLYKNTDQKVVSEITLDDLLAKVTEVVREDWTSGGRIKAAAQRIERNGLEEYTVKEDGEGIVMNRWKLNGKRISKAEGGFED